MWCVIRVFMSLGPFFRVVLLFHMCLPQGWCVGVDLMVCWLRSVRKNHQNECRKCRCIMGASTWKNAMWFVLTCGSLLSSRAVWVRLDMRMCWGYIPAIVLYSCGIRCLRVSECSCHCMQFFHVRMSSVVYHCMDYYTPFFSPV